MNLKMEEEKYLRLLDLVAIGTISDIVPLVDENRVIAKLGLKLIKQTQNIGLQTLIKIAGFKKLDSYSISYGIAPRINASGRMGHAKEALELFITENYEQARQIANKLNVYNLNRQEVEKRITKEVLEELNNKDTKDLQAIVLGNEDWHHGVIRYSVFKSNRKLL